MPVRRACGQGCWYGGACGPACQYDESPYISCLYGGLDNQRASTGVAALKLVALGRVGVGKTSERTAARRVGFIINDKSGGGEGGRNATVSEGGPEKRKKERETES